MLLCYQQRDTVMAELTRLSRDPTISAVVLTPHWGDEGASRPKPSDRLYARAAIEAGATAVIGTHPHVLQPWERINGVSVFYGLGNFMFSDIDAPGEFDASGVSTKRMRKRWRMWNRRSLGVQYDLATGRAEPLGFRDTGTVIEPRSARSVGGRELTTPNDAAYRREFDRSFAYGILRAKIGAFLAEPRLPRLRHFRSIAHIARQITPASADHPDA